MSQFPKTEPANTEFPHICTGATAHGTAVVLPDAVFLFMFKLDDI
jgi:hypothetical protein